MGRGRGGGEAGGIRTMVERPHRCCTGWGGVLGAAGVSLALVGLCTWTVVLYNLKLQHLQHRVDKLEEQCETSKHSMDTYLEQHLDSLLEKVR